MHNSYMALRVTALAPIAAFRGIPPGTIHRHEAESDANSFVRALEVSGETAFAGGDFTSMEASRGTGSPH